MVEGKRNVGAKLGVLLAHVARDIKSVGSAKRGKSSLGGVRKQSNRKIKWVAVKRWASILKRIRRKKRRSQARGDVLCLQTVK